ncbi:MAG: NUDIX domain-containing protein [Clostridia bacterium]|nr:NUDIX domain-containing protein [Clostridia bacterium]
MKQEKSCGAVVFTCVGSEIRYVRAQSRAGHYGFQKGHVESGETEKETALREIYEEVGLCPVLLDGFREMSEYEIPSLGIRKQVVLFLGYYESQEIIPQESELKKAVTVSYEEAMALLEHEDNKLILTSAEAFLRKNGKDIL